MATEQQRVDTNTHRWEFSTTDEGNAKGIKPQILESDPGKLSPIIAAMISTSTVSNDMASRLTSEAIPKPMFAATESSSRKIVCGT